MEELIGKEIEITKRKVSDKVQPLFAIASRFIVEDVEFSEREIVALIVKHPSRKGATLRCGASRFEWKVVKSNPTPKTQCSFSGPAQVFVKPASSGSFSCLGTASNIDMFSGQSIMPHLPRPSYFDKPMTSEEIMNEIRHREALKQAAMLEIANRKAEQDKRLLDVSLSEEAKFALTYIPFVIIEVAWVYVDTLFDLVKMAGLTETKKLCRAIRQLHEEYDYKRFRNIDRETRKSETENMILFQDELSKEFGNMYKTLRNALTDTYGELEENTSWIISTAYVVHIILKAMYKFEEAQNKILRSILRYEPKSLIPTEVKSLCSLILEFAGDMRLPKDKQHLVADFTNEFATYINDIQINKTGE